MINDYENGLDGEEQLSLASAHPSHIDYNKNSSSPAFVREELMLLTRKALLSIDFFIPINKTLVIFHLNA